MKTLMVSRSQGSLQKLMLLCRGVRASAVALLFTLVCPAHARAEIKASTEDLGDADIVGGNDAGDAGEDADGGPGDSGGGC